LSSFFHVSEFQGRVGKQVSATMSRLPLAAWEEPVQPQMLSGLQYRQWRRRIARHREQLEAPQCSMDLGRYERDIDELSKVAAVHKRSRRFKRSEEESWAQRGNNMLVQKLCAVARQSERRQLHILASARQEEAPSLNFGLRRKKHNAIHADNLSLMRRLESARSVVPSASELAQSHNNQTILSARVSRVRQPVAMPGSRFLPKIKQLRGEQFPSSGSALVSARGERQDPCTDVFRMDTLVSVVSTDPFLQDVSRRVDGMGASRDARGKVVQHESGSDFTNQEVCSSKSSRAACSLNIVNGVKNKIADLDVEEAGAHDTLPSLVTWVAERQEAHGSPRLGIASAFEQRGISEPSDAGEKNTGAQKVASSIGKGDRSGTHRPDGIAVACDDLERKFCEEKALSCLSPHAAGDDRATAHGGHVDELEQNHEDVGGVGSPPEEDPGADSDAGSTNSYSSHESESHRSQSARSEGSGSRGSSRASDESANDRPRSLSRASDASARDSHAAQEESPERGRDAAAGCAAADLFEEPDLVNQSSVRKFGEDKDCDRPHSASSSHSNGRSENRSVDAGLASDETSDFQSRSSERSRGATGSLDSAVLNGDTALVNHAGRTGSHTSGVEQSQRSVGASQSVTVADEAGMDGYSDDDFDASRTCGSGSED